MIESKKDLDAIGIKLEPDVSQGENPLRSGSTRFTLVWDVGKLPADIKACSLDLLIFKPDDPLTPPKSNSPVGTRFTIDLGKSGKDRNPIRTAFTVSAEEMKSAVLTFYQGSSTELAGMDTVHFLGLADFVAGFRSADPFDDERKPNNKGASDGGCVDTDSAYISKMIDCEPKEEILIAQAYKSFLDLIAKREVTKDELRFPARLTTQNEDGVVFCRAFYISPNELRGFELFIPKDCVTQKNGLFVATVGLVVDREDTRQGMRRLILKRAQQPAVGQPATSPESK